MVLLETVGTLTLITAIVGLLGTLIAGIVAIIKAIQAGKYLQAAKDGGALLQATSAAIDMIKTGTADTAGRYVVEAELKNMGMRLDALGLKETMDAKLKELGLDDRS